MNRLKNLLAVAGILCVPNKLFAAGPTVELIAYDQSSHVGKIGVYGGWNMLSGTSAFNKLVEFKTEIFQNTRDKKEFQANWGNFNFGLQAGYTHFFNQKWGWNVLDIKGGYSKFATFVLQSEADNQASQGDEEIENTFKFGGLSFDVLTGLAINFLKDGLDFEEGNQYGHRFVLNFNVGVNFNLEHFDIDGDTAFKETYLDAHFDGTTKPWKLIFEPSIEFVARFGLFTRLALHTTYFGPWESERRRDADFSAKENKTESLPNTLGFAPTLELGWDFSALIN